MKNCAFYAGAAKGKGPKELTIMYYVCRGALRFGERNMAVQQLAIGELLVLYVSTY